MRSPELFVVGGRSEDAEHLSRFEAVAEAVASQIDDIAEQACKALDTYTQSSSVGKLADIHGKLVAMVSGIAEAGQQNVEDAATGLLSRVRMAMQKIWRTGSFSFSNEAIFDQFGKKQERGIVSDALFLSEMEGDDEDGLVPEHYGSTSLDTAYSIDHITVWSEPSEDASDMRKIDLVQVKTSKEKVSDIERERILKNHKDFLRDKRLTIEEFRSVEVPEAQVDALIEALGEEREKLISDKWLEAVTDPGPSGEEIFKKALADFQKSVSEDKVFIKASRPLKRAYVESLDIEGTEDGDVFTQWKNQWLLSIKDKKERVLEPVHVPVIRSVIHYRGGEREVEVIGKLD